MTESKKKPPRKPRPRRRTVNIGGTSQSEFAGYAPKTGNKRAKRGKPPRADATDADTNPATDTDEPE